LAGGSTQLHLGGYKLAPKLLQNVNMKPHAIYQMVLFPVTLSDSDVVNFKVTLD